MVMVMVMVVVECLFKHKVSSIVHTKKIYWYFVCLYVLVLILPLLQL